jgi:type IV secretory pathway TraG/TraD family ATPase VirD4
MSKTIITSVPLASPHTSSSALRIDSKQLFSPPVLLFCVVLILYIWTQYFWKIGKSKRVLARAYLGSNPERTKARKIAMQQIRERIHNKVSLWIGTPAGFVSERHEDNSFSLYIPEDPRTVYLTNMQAGTLIFGAPDTGKSWFCIDPLTRSAIDQGFPVVYYDFKGHEDPPPSGTIAAYAKQNYYQVSIMAPGYPDTCTCNILDFLENEADAESAREIAAALNRNLKLGKDGSSNSSYFSEAGDQLAQAVLMLAKSHPQGDVVLCQKLLTELSKPSVVKAIRDNHEQPRINPWTRIALDQFFSTAETPETAASIASTASLLFTRFMVPSALAAFSRKTTLPTHLDGRQLVVFKMNPNNRATIAPLMAATLQQLVSRNIFRPRKTPLVLVLDEVGSIYLPKLGEFLNQMRSSGLVTILAAQSLGVLEETYGKDLTNSIVGGCATQIVFQLNDPYTANFFSRDMLGQEQIDYFQNSRSFGRDRSRSVSEHSHTRPLVEVQQLMSLPTGKALILNRGYQNNQEVRVPIFVQLQIPKWDQLKVAQSRQMWPQLQKELASCSLAIPPKPEDLNIAQSLARQIVTELAGKPLSKKVPYTTPPGVQILDKPLDDDMRIAEMAIKKAGWRIEPKTEDDLKRAKDLEAISKEHHLKSTHNEKNEKSE